MTTFFSMFPTILHTVDGKTATLMKDFLRRVSPTVYAQNQGVIYTNYVIKDGETPEMISNQFYNTPHLYWIILVTNNIIDIRTDWCMSSDALQVYCENKYQDVNAVHHYENAKGQIVDQGAAVHTVSNLEYETKLNENRRNIKILLPQLANDFITEYHKNVNL